MSEQIKIWITPSLNMKIRKRAKETKRKLSEWIRLVLEKHFEKLERD